MIVNHEGLHLMSLSQYDEGGPRCSSAPRAPQYSKNVDATQAGARLRLSAAWLAHFQTKLSGMSEEGAGKGLEV